MIFEIEKNAEKYGNKPAYWVDGKTYSYFELFERAKEISKELLQIKSSSALIFANRSFETMAAIIACIISRIAYVPVDISLPEERREKIIKCSKSSVIIDCSGEKAIIKKIGTEEKTKENETAYIIFTSGSTGEPKGVPISYENLDNFIRWIKELEPMNQLENEAVLNHASFSFDLSTAAIFYALFGGHTLVQYENDGNFEHLFSAMKENKTGVLVATPTFIRLCLLNGDFSEKEYPFIKCIYFCGETLQKSLVYALFKRFPKIRIINAYGPTEATSAVCAAEITKETLENEETLPVGIISLAATEIAIENEEIVLKGKSVFEGYLGKQSGGYYKENEKNCFKTGDLGYIRDGKIYFKGRKDNQIKYKGYRIELSDIEANIFSVSGIEDCAVIAKRNTEGEVRIIKAFVCGNISEKELRTELLKKLPEYMIPKTIKFLEKLPLNQNGKTDRKALESL